MTAWRSKQAMPAGRLSVTHYKVLHHHLFQDVIRGPGLSHGADFQGRQRFRNCQAISVLTEDDPF